MFNKVDVLEPAAHRRVVYLRCTVGLDRLQSNSQIERHHQLNNSEWE